MAAVANPARSAYDSDSSDCELPAEMMADLNRVGKREDMVVELKEMNEELNRVQEAMFSVPRSQRAELRAQVLFLAWVV